MTKRNADRNVSERFLAALLRTPDGELGLLARERLGSDARVDLVHLKRVKAIVEKLATTLSGATEDDVQRVRLALELLTQEALSPQKDPAPARPVPTTAAPIQPAPPPGVAPFARSADPSPRSPWAARSLEANPSLGETQQASPRAPAQPLPFRPASPGSAPPAISYALEPNANLGETAPVDSKQRPGPAMPFQAPKGKEPASTQALEAYAKFCAACSLYPTRHAEIRRQYGFEDDLAFMRLEAKWREHFARMPQAREMFELLVAQYTSTSTR